MEERVIACVDRSDPSPFSGSVAHVVELPEQITELDDPKQEQYQKRCDKREFDEAGAIVLIAEPQTFHLNLIPIAYHRSFYQWRPYIASLWSYRSISR